MITCRELADFLGDYLAGDLPDETRAAFDAHLRLCPNCRRYLASYDAAVKLGKHAFDTDGGAVPADVPEDLVKAILDARSRQQP